MLSSKAKPNLYLTPAGFTVRADDELQHDVAKITVLSHSGARVGHLRPNDQTVDDVRELYADMVAGELNTKDPAIIRRIAEVYKKHFSRDTIDVFLRNQYDNPYINGVVAELVKDTFRFIDTNRRHLELSTLLGLLQAETNSNGLAITQKTRLLKDSFYAIDMKQHLNSIRRQVETLGLSSRGNQMDPVAHLWFTKQGGPEDIVCTMYIVFCFNPL